MYCKSCGAAMDPSHLVCQMCGVKKGLGRAFCENCGSVRQVGTAFCQECGFKFVDDVQAEQGYAAPSVPLSQQTPAQQFESAAVQNNSQYMPAKKFCRNCGGQVMNTQAICTRCGVKVGQGTSFCPHCAAPVANPQAIACTSCGMSLKEPFNASAYFQQFADNFTNIFKDNDVLTLLLDYGAYLASFLTFILSLLPIAYVSVSVLGYSSSQDFNSWFNPFCGFLFLLAFLVSVARFVPHVDNFIKGNALVNKFAVFVVPALMLVSMLLITISILSGAGAGFAASTVYASAGCGFTFWGVLLILVVLASVAASVLSYLRKQGIVKF